MPVLMSAIPVTTKNSKDRTAQSWPCPSLATTQGKLALPFADCSSRGSRSCTFLGSTVALTLFVRGSWS